MASAADEPFLFTLLLTTSRSPMNRLTLILTASTLLVISLGVRAHGNQDPSQGETPGGRRSVEHGGILKEYMGTLADSMDFIEDSLFPQTKEDANDDWDAHLAKVIELQQGGLWAKAELPRTLEAMPAGDQKSMALAYTKVMHELIEQLFKMEAALMEHDRKAWEVALTDMEKARTRGHKQFKPKRNRRGGGQRGNGDK